MVELSSQDLEVLKRVVYGHAGILLGEKEHGLLAARVSRRLSRLGLDSVAAYLERLGGVWAGHEIPALIDAVTINYTYFFREENQFRFLCSEAIPALLRIAAGREDRRLRVWSAGCSTGEEPYSVAIAFAECPAGPQAHDLRILATDINRKVLRHAVRGIYSEDRLQGIPPECRHKYLVRDAITPPGCFRLEQEVRERVSFRRMNLLGDLTSLHGQLDLILCRNVMIYFDEPSKERLLHGLASCLVRGGYLLIGESDELNCVPPSLAAVSATAFVKTARHREG